MAKHGDVDDVRIFRIDHDAGDALRILETHPGEGLAGVRRFIDAVTEARALAIVRFAGADPENVRIRRGDGDVADRCSRVGVKDRSEGCAVIGGLPDAAGRRADIANV